MKLNVSVHNYECTTTEIQVNLIMVLTSSADGESSFIIK